MNEIKVGDLVQLNFDGGRLLKHIKDDIGICMSNSFMNHFEVYWQQNGRYTMWKEYIEKV